MTVDFKVTLETAQKLKAAMKRDPRGVEEEAQLHLPLEGVAASERRLIRAGHGRSIRTFPRSRSINPTLYHVREVVYTTILPDD